MIAVTFALAAESSGFVRLIRNGRSHDHEVVVLHTGVGARVAEKRLSSFLENNSPRLLISAGFAGGLTSALRVGDLLLSENFSDPSLLESARALGSVGKLRTIPSIIDSPKERAELARNSGALAVDMETESIAGICAQHRIPMLSLRAISDSPDAPFSVPADVLFDLEQQRTNFAQLFGHLVRHPGDVAKLVAIARQTKIARRALTDALENLFRILPGR